MLDQIELVFNWLKSFNLKNQAKKVLFFQTSVIFLGHIFSADGISANSEKVDKLRDLPVSKDAKELHSFLGLTSYYHWFILNFAHVAKCLHQLIGPTDVKHCESKKVKKEVTTLEKLELTKAHFVWMSEHQIALTH